MAKKINLEGIIAKKPTASIFRANVPGLKMKDFTIFNAMDRIKQQGDIFTGVLGKGINLKKSIKNIETVFGKQEMHTSLRK